MTAEEMRDEFRSGFDEAMSFSAPSLDHYDISLFLTRAQEGVLKRRLRAKGNKYWEGFDTTEKRKRDFDELIRSVIASASSVSTGVVPNGIFYNLPIDHMYTIMERVDIKLKVADPCYPTGIISNIAVKPITYDTYLSNKNNPFKKPYKELVWRLVHSRDSASSVISSTNQKRQQLITDGTYDIYRYYLTYLSRPKPIITGTLSSGMSIDGLSVVTDCELDPQIHREIVTDAIRIASAAFRDPGYQMDMAESQLSE